MLTFPHHGLEPPLLMYFKFSALLPFPNWFLTPISVPDRVVFWNSPYHGFYSETRLKVRSFESPSLILERAISLPHSVLFFQSLAFALSLPASSTYAQDIFSSIFLSRYPTFCMPPCLHNPLGFCFLVFHMSVSVCLKILQFHSQAGSAYLFFLLCRYRVFFPVTQQLPPFPLPLS